MRGTAISAPRTFYALETIAIKSNDYDALGILIALCPIAHKSS